MSINIILDIYHNYTLNKTDFDSARDSIIYTFSNEEEDDDDEEDEENTLDLNKIFGHCNSTNSIKMIKILLFFGIIENNLILLCFGIRLLIDPLQLEFSRSLLEYKYISDLEPNTETINSKISLRYLKRDKFVMN